MGRHSLPNVDWIASTRPGRSAFSASILLTMIMRQSLRALARSIIRRVIDSMPAAASTTTAIVSTAGIMATAWPMKSGMPGVSITLMCLPLKSQWTTADCRLCPCSFSSSVKSLTVSPFSTRPGEPMTPAAWSSASARVVLPDPA